jgi:hypothetical protein
MINSSSVGVESFFFFSFFLFFSTPCIWYLSHLSLCHPIDTSPPTSPRVHDQCFPSVFSPFHLCLTCLVFACEPYISYLLFCVCACFTCGQSLSFSMHFSAIAIFTSLVSWKGDLEKEENRTMEWIGGKFDFRRVFRFCSNFSAFKCYRLCFL